MRLDSELQIRNSNEYTNNCSLSLSTLLTITRLKVLRFEISEDPVQISLLNNEHIHDSRKFFFIIPTIDLSQRWVEL